MITIVTSVTVPTCFECFLQTSLRTIGVSYKLVLSDSNLSLSESYNSVIKTNLEDVERSRYLLFVDQDILITGKDWGRRLVKICDSLPDFGYGGVECRRTVMFAMELFHMTEKEVTYRECEIGYEEQDGTNVPATEVTLCDAGFIILPSRLFIERQFDTQFPWYPMAEDYALWVRKVKKLKVYHLPVEGYTTDTCTIQSKLRSRFSSKKMYYDWLYVEHEKLLKKWGLRGIGTTTFPGTEIVSE